MPLYASRERRAPFARRCNAPRTSSTRPLRRAWCAERAASHCERLMAAAGASGAGGAGGAASAPSHVVDGTDDSRDATSAIFNRSHAKLRGDLEHVQVSASSTTNSCVLGPHRMLDVNNPHLDDTHTPGRQHRTEKKNTTHPRRSHAIKWAHKQAVGGTPTTCKESTQEVVKRGHDASRSTWIVSCRNDVLSAQALLSHTSVQDPELDQTPIPTWTVNKSRA